MTAKENLSKLKKSSLPMTFVKKQKGNWDHQEWLNFCSQLKEKGYDPIDLDQVGLILEEKKKKFLDT